MEKEKKIYKRIKELRQTKGLSGVKLAEMLGITAQYYYDIEKGERRLTVDIALQLGKIHGVSVDYIIEREEQISLSPEQGKFVNDLVLTDEDLKKKYKLVVNGKEATEEQIRKAMEFLRALQIMEDDELK